MLNQKLLEKINHLKSGNTATHPSIDTEKPKQKRTPAINESLKGILEEILNELSKSVLGTDNFIQILMTMGKLINNPLKYPEEEKFRVINLQNAKIQNLIGCYKGTIEFLMRIGFYRNKDNNLELEGNIDDFEDSLLTGKAALESISTKFSNKEF